MSHQPTNLLLILPTNVASLVLSDWVGVKGTVKADSAFCSSVTRPKFLEILRASECVLNLNDDRKLADDMVMWATLRQAWVGSVSIGDNSHFQSYEEYLSDQGSSITRVRLVSLINNSESGMGLILTHCKHVTRLHLRRCRLDAFFCHFLSAVPTLQELCIDFHDALTELNLIQLSSVSCPNLHTVQLSWCTDSDLLSACVKMACNVQKLRLSHCGDLSTHTVQCINPAVSILSITDSVLTNEILVEAVNRCPGIVCLNVSSSDGNVNIGMEYAAKHLTRLKAVNLYYNRILDQCLDALALYRSDTLTELHVFCYRGITSSAVNNLLSKCTNLTTLALSTYSCTIDLDIRLMSRITVLFIAGDGEACRDIFRSIATHCSALTRFGVYITNYLYTLELNEIVQKCTRLIQFSVEQEFHKSITPAVLAQWRAWRPHLAVSLEFDSQTALQSFGGFS